MDRIIELLKYHPYITAEDIEKIYQRKENKGLFLIEIDSKVRIHLEKTVGAYAKILNDIRVGSNTMPNYFDNKYNITFFPAADNIDIDADASPDRIVDEPALIKLLAEIEPINKHNLGAHIRYDYDTIVACLNLYLSFHPKSVNQIMSSPDLLHMLQEEIKRNHKLYEGCKAIIERKNQNIFSRLKNILQQFHDVLQDENGIKNTFCRTQYDKIREVTDEEMSVYINNRARILESMLSTNNRTNKLLNTYLQLGERILKPCDDSDDYARLQQYGLPYILSPDLMAKIQINCSMRTPTTFPIKISVPMLQSVSRYESFPSNHNNLVFCGSLLVPLIGHCAYMKFNSALFNYYGDNPSLHTYFIYFNLATRSFVIYNYRGNLVGDLRKDLVTINNFYERYSQLYLQLNSLYYSKMKAYDITNGEYAFSLADVATVEQVYPKVRMVKMMKDSVTKRFYFTGARETDSDSDSARKEISALKTELQTILDKQRGIVAVPDGRNTNTVEKKFWYQSHKDKYKMRKDYIWVDYPDILADTKFLHDHTSKNKISFVGKQAGARNVHIERYKNAELYLTNDKFYDSEFKQRLYAIINSYEKSLQLGSTLEKLIENNYSTTLKEPTASEIETFLVERQREISLYEHTPYFEKLHLDRMMRMPPHDRTCDNDYVWSDADIAETDRTSTCAKFDNATYPMLKQYYPERYGVNEREQFALRPTMLGYLEDQEKYDDCQKYFRTKFSIDQYKIKSKYLNWSFDLNKVFIKCVLDNSELIFPLLLIDPEFEKRGRYNTFRDDMQYEYEGILSIPFTDIAQNKVRSRTLEYYIFSMRTATDYALLIFNHRSNIVTPGTFFDQYKVTFTELNQIYYNEQHFNVYLYYPSKFFAEQKKIYLFSTYSKEEIAHLYKTKYKNIYTPEEISTLITELVPVSFIKDDKTKIFSFPEMNGQLGGGAATTVNLYKTGYVKIIKTKDEPRLNIKISSKQAYFDPSIYPINKLKKYLDRANNIKRLFGSEEKYNEAIKHTYKYYPLKNKYPGFSSGPDKPTYNKKYKPIISDAENNILLYQFFYPETVTLLEYFLNFDLINTKSKILLVTRTAGYLEAVCYYLQKYLSKGKFDNILVLMPEYTIEDFSISRARGVIDLYNLNYVLIKNPLNSAEISKLAGSDQYDYVLIDPHIYAPALVPYVDQAAHTLLVSLLLLMLQTLKRGGNASIILPMISTRVTAQIIYYVASLFETKYIYHTQTTQNSYISYAVMLMGFEGANAEDTAKITKLNNALYILDETGYKNYNILDDTARANFGITKEISADTQREFIENFADYTDDDFTRTILSFNKQYLSHFKSFLDNLQEYYDNKSDAKYIEYVRNNSIMESINFAKQIDLEIKPGVLKDLSSDKFYIWLTRQMFSYDNVIKFEFLKVTDCDFVLEPRAEKISPALKKLATQYHLAAQIIDTRDPDQYDYVKKYVRYYERTLADKLKEKHNISFSGRRVSRAWIKFFEMMHEVPMLDNIGAVNSFHICEAPGNFIMSLQYFIKRRTTLEFNWAAQSLRESKIFDDYGLISKNPTKWDFGPEKTGDITDVANIRYYVNKYGKKNFITADCGTSWDERDLTSKLKYCMIVSIMGILAEGGNFIFKTLMPVTEQIIISLYYILHCCFEKFIFFKPLQNAWSPEFYVVGINYKRKLTSEEYDVLLGCIPDYNQRISLVKKTPSYDKFIIQLENITNKLKNNFRLAIQRNIYFVDNWDELTREDRMKIKANIEEKNDAWIKRFLD